MPRNGSGSYSLPNGPFVPSTVISSTVMNQNLNDLGTALTQSIANDGQTTPVANLPMATFRHTNVGNALARNEYAAAGQVQDSSLLWLTSIAGTDTITASVVPSPTTYTAGQTFRFIPAGANTTTAVTLNINGLGAKAITKIGSSALGAGDIQSGAVVEVVYDGTQFQLMNVSMLRLIGVPTVISATGTFTSKAGTRAVRIRMVGGGGGGGGSAATGAGQGAVGGAGGSGAYAEFWLTSGFSGGISCTIGAAGTGGTAGSNAGTSGTATSFGAVASAPGGLFGAGGTVAASPAVGIFGNGGSVATVSGGTLITRMSGQDGGLSVVMANAVAGGAGGSSPLGMGGAASFNLGGASTAGRNATGFGSGGGGAAAASSAAAAAGGNGAPGLIVVEEYA